MSDQKKAFDNIGEYLVSKSGAKYIKLQAAPNAPDHVKQKVAKLIEANGGDVLFVNLFDAEFREKYNIPEFSKGRISSPQDGGEQTQAKGNNTKSKDGVNF